MRGWMGVVGLVLIAACGGGSGDGGIVEPPPPPPPPPVQGRYVLASVNGGALPWVAFRIGDSFRQEVASGVVTLAANGTFTDSLVVRDVDRVLPAVTRHLVAAGTYTRQGDTVRFSPATGPVYAMTTASGRLEQRLAWNPGDPPATFSYAQP